MVDRLVPIFFRFRYAVLAVLAAGTAAALYIQTPSLYLAFAVAAGFGVALIALRHGLLALVVALAPLPGLLWTFAPSHYLEAFTLRLAPGMAWFTSSTYPVPLALGLLMAFGLTERLLRGGSTPQAFAALFDVLRPAAGLLALAFIWSVWEADATLVALIASCLSVLVAVPAGAMVLPYGERFHFSGNRARETRAHVLEFAARLAEPRWAFSLSGIALVFAVLAWFGVAHEFSFRDWIVPVLIGAILFCETGDLRAAIASVLAAALLLLLHPHTHHTLLLFLLLALVLGRGAELGGSWARVIENRYGAVFVAVVAAAATTAVLDSLQVGVEFLYAGIIALIVFPAITLALHFAVPPRKSVEQLYKS